MIEIRWMAPIEVGMSCQPGADVREPERCSEVWSRLSSAARSTGECATWRFHREISGRPVLGWTEAAGESLPYPLEIVSGSTTDANVDAFRNVTFRSVEWSLYDFGVFLVHGYLSVPNTFLVGGKTSKDLERLAQNAASRLATDIARAETERFRKLLRRVPNGNQVLQIREKETSQPIWVTRALVVDPRDAQSRELASQWISAINSEHIHQLREFLGGDRPYVAQWLNHLHRSDETQQVDEGWRALQRAQFFWAAMQFVDHTLRQILAWSISPGKDVSLFKLRTELEASVNSAQELLMVKAEVMQHASRRRNEEMNRYLALWEYKELLETPAREKIDACHQRLSHLSNERAARSAFFTDLILMSIGVTSVLATAIALVQFGRSASTDPDQSMFDFGSGALTTWLSAQPMDAILVLSVLVSAILVVVFVWKRRQTLS